MKPTIKKRETEEALKEQMAKTWDELMTVAKESGTDPYEIVQGFFQGKKRKEIRELKRRIIEAIPEEKRATAIELFRKHGYEDKKTGVMCAETLEDRYKRELEESEREDEFETSLFVNYLRGKTLNISFAQGTFNVIGGRPGAGKTAALCSLACEAMDQGKKVLYITDDQSIKDIILKMQMAMLARKYYLQDKDNDPLFAGWDNDEKMAEIICDPKYPRKILRKKFIALTRAFPVNADVNGTPCCERAIKRAQEDGYKAFFDRVRSQQFAIMDPGDLRLTDEYEWEDFAENIRYLKPGSIVMIDYLQAFNVYPEAKKEALEQQKNLVVGIHNLAKETGCIFICAAQLTRGSEAVDKLSYLSMSDFADCSEIEKRANVAIGMGSVREYASDYSRHYYRILKWRDVDQSDPIWLDRAGYAYNFVHTELDYKGIPQFTPTGADWRRKMEKKREEQEKAQEKEFYEEIEADMNKEDPSLLPPEAEGDNNTSKPAVF